jgi:hypothetical protein
LTAFYKSNEEGQAQPEFAQPCELARKDART